MTRSLPLTTLRAQITTITNAKANDPLYDSYRNLYQLNFSEVDHHLGLIDLQGFSVACQVFSPADPKGAVILQHGYHDHFGLMKHWVRYLLDKQLVVVGCDLPGHGLSGGDRASIDGFSSYQSVFGKLIELTQQKAQPLSFVGQSTGAAIISDYLLTHPDQNAEQLVYLAPLVRPRYWLAIRTLYLILGRGLRQVPRKFTDNSHDSAFLEFIQHQDPLQNRHTCTTWIGSMIRWQSAYLGLPSRTDLRPMIIQGQQDNTVDWRFNLKVLRRQFPQAEELLLPTGKHNLANEIPSIREAYFAWLDQHWPNQTQSSKEESD